MSRNTGDEVNPDIQMETLTEDDSRSTVYSSPCTELKRKEDPEDEEDFCNHLLQPFAHQVSGHFPLVCLDEETICKPIIEREHQIYRAMPDSLKPFVPNFRGSMRVEVREKKGGYVTLTGNPPPEYINRIRRSQDPTSFDRDSNQSSFSNGTNKHHQKLSLLLGRFNDNPVEKSDATARKAKKMAAKRGQQLSYIWHRSENDTSGSGQTSLAPGDDGIMETEILKEQVFCNQWALKCHRDHLPKFGLLSLDDQNHSLSSSHAYLLLENVVNHYAKPCVLDLKVGKRQYSDDDSDAKMQQKIARSNQTTSATLGLRLCGMQVYSCSKRRYECLNKYEGRALNDGAFISTIEKFLNKEDNDHQELVVDLIEKLISLKNVLQELNSFRFFTCSLLVTYDAASLKSETASDKVDVRMIDFAHSTHQGLNDPIEYEGPDDGFISGLDSFIRILQTM